ncbi:CHAT domain-containing protein [Saccharopolyspora sp. NPDC000359]|uniref:CHAT domain-containing protein n=1 Tax=Saccharopolyspora sp. NPDC000359 TaxID=3154251 RepID=UPI00331FE248
MTAEDDVFSLRDRYRRTGDPAMEERLVDAARQWVAEDPTAAFPAAVLGSLLMARHERTSDTDAMGEAISALRRAVDSAAPGDPGAADAVAALGMALTSRYDNGNRLSDLDESIRLLSRATGSGGGDRSLWWSGLGTALRKRFERTGNTADATAAVAASRRALRALPGGDPRLGRFQAALAITLADRAERVGDAADLDEAISLLRRAIGNAGTPDQAAAWEAQLGTTLLTRFRATQRTEDVDEAVERMRELVDALPTGHPHRPTAQAVLDAALAARHVTGPEPKSFDPALAGVLAGPGIDFQQRFEATHDRADSDRALSAFREAVRTAADPASRSLALFLVGTALRSRRERIHDVSLVDEEIAVLRHLVGGSRDRARALADLGDALQARAESTGERADLDEAIDLHRQAADLATGDAARADFLCRLGLALQVRFDRTGLPEDIDESIARGREAVTIAASPKAQFALASGLATRFHRSTELAELDEAIDLLRSAATSDVPSLPVILANLTTALWSRFEHVGRTADLEAAVESGRRAVAAAPEGHPDHAACLTTLSTALRLRAQSTGSTEDVVEAVGHLRRIAASNPGPDAQYALATALISHAYQPDRIDPLDEAIDLLRQASAHPRGPRDKCLSSLVLALRVRHSHSGDRQDLDEAIAVGHEAIGEHASAAARFELATVLRTRFERTGELSDLDDAIEQYAQAASTASSASRRSDVLSSLSLARQARFHRTGSVEDLSAAVEHAREAVAARRHDHGQRAGLLSNLSIALLDWHEHTDDPAALDEAVELGREAVEAATDEHPDLVNFRSALGGALHVRFERQGVRADLDEAINHQREAVSLLPAGHPKQSANQVNLSASLARRSVHSGDSSDLAEAVELGRAAVAVEAAPPSHRMHAATTWGRAAAAVGAWQPATEALSAGVALLPQLASPDLHRRTREYWLADVAGLASDAAACAVRTGNPHQAVTLLEQGRGVLLAEAFNRREDVEALHQQAPELAERYEQLRRQLDSEPTEAADVVAARRRIVTDHDAVVARIRALPGFERFLLPAEPGELQAQAADGPVVVLNVSAFGSSALILTPGGIVATELPQVTPAAVATQAEKLRTALTKSEQAWEARDVAAQHDAQNDVRAVLAWLWRAVAHPVLDHFPSTGGPSRVWWVPTGLLGFLPIHAAEDGDHALVDRVISSYAPTIRALRHARDRPARAAPRQVLAVAMPQTPKQPPLPGAFGELQALTARFGATAQPLLCEQATRSRVFAELPRHDWAHFACHGTSNLADPSAGLLVLHDHDAHPVTAADVARLDLGSAELAFLSACETAQPGDRLADEAIHLASAFQSAGYRHVVATLWRPRDRVAVKLVESFYAELADGTTTTPATALHRATHRLRTEYPNFPTVWAANIHIGP